MPYSIVICKAREKSSEHGFIYVPNRDFVINRIVIGISSYRRVLGYRIISITIWYFTFHPIIWYDFFLFWNVNFWITYRKWRTCVFFYEVLYHTYQIELIYTFILGDFTFNFTLFAIVNQLIFVDMEVVPSINKTLSLHQQKKRSKRPRQKTNYRIKYKVQYP